jgi:DNA-binding transcriptional LysR family regulator
MGLGILSLHSIELELETKRLAMLNVEHFPLLRHWFIVHRSNKRLSSAASAFKDFLLGKSDKAVHPHPKTGTGDPAVSRKRPS